MPKKLAYRILTQLVIATGLLIGILLWNGSFLVSFYLGEQLTNVGKIVNAGIVVLFFIGIFRITHLLVVSAREETAIKRFFENLRAVKDDLLDKVCPSSLIAGRYQTMQKLHKQGHPIDHGALASILLAKQTTETATPRYIHNILILVGMFGTIISLAIALTGASELITSMVNTDGMGAVIHGMSTALSTTLTAIVAYVFFAYFHNQMESVHTNIAQSIEHITTTELMPRFRVTGDSIQEELVSLITNLKHLVHELQTKQRDLSSSSIELHKVARFGLEQMNEFGKTAESIHQTLKAGFRLTEERH